MAQVAADITEHVIVLAFCLPADPADREFTNASSHDIVSSYTYLSSYSAGRRDSESTVYLAARNNCSSS